MAFRRSTRSRTETYSRCPAGSEALPGGPCTPTSLADCPAGTYADPDVEAMGATFVHVRAGADATSDDGGAARPYATVGAGIIPPASCGCCELVCTLGHTTTYGYHDSN